MRRTASEILSDLEIRIARLEKSSYYIPSISDSLDPIDNTYSRTKRNEVSGQRFETEQFGQWNRRYTPVMDVRMPSLNRAKPGQKIDASRLTDDLSRFREETLMMATFNGFNPTNVDSRVERSIAGQKSNKEMYYDDALDYIRPRSTVIMGYHGFYVIDGKKAYFFY